MKDLSMEERRHILFDLQVMTSKEVRQKWNITNNVLSHIRFIHGKSNANAGGHYHKDLTENGVNPIITKIKTLKETGMTSLEVATELKLSLAMVNRNW